MAKNTGSGSRIGAVDADGSATGKGTFMDAKQDGTRFKGLAVEPDGRRNKG